MLPIPLTAPQILNRDFLEVRAKILELAACLDRLERADGSVTDDPRMKQIHQGLTALDAVGAKRAEQVQLLFSLPYDEAWRKKWEL
ncbi:MAG: hypothetical protein K8U03_13475 [Planctomycetia bacterium]|nr:hypothetical protein [Planctomycetia bacterium]